MNEPLCPSYTAIDPVGSVLYLILAIVVMIFIISRLWKHYPPTCGQMFFAPLSVLLLVMLFLAPVAQLITSYMLRAVGTEATAVVIDHCIISGKALFPHRLGFMYGIREENGAVCMLIQRDEEVPAEVYKQFDIGSSIPIRFLPYSPAVAHIDSATQVGWSYLLFVFVALIAGGVVAILKQYKWV